MDKGNPHFPPTIGNSLRYILYGVQILVLSFFCIFLPVPNWDAFSAIQQLQTCEGSFQVSSSNSSSQAPVGVTASLRLKIRLKPVRILLAQAQARSFGRITIGFAGNQKCLVLCNRSREIDCNHCTFCRHMNSCCCIHQSSSILTSLPIPRPR